MTDTQQHDLDSLIFELFDDKISQEDHQRLDTWLQEDPHALERYLALSELHNVLEIDTTHGRHEIASQVIPIKEILKRQKRRTVMISTAIAAILIIGCMLAFQQFTTKQNPPLVSLEFSEHSQFSITHAKNLDTESNDKVLDVGSKITLHQGSVAFTFANGVKSVLHAPLDLKVVSENKLSMKQGKAWFNVPPEAIGFEVITPEMKVVDLGTEFGIITDLSDTQGDEIHVFKGKVEVQSRFGRKKKATLLAGNARQVHFTGKLVTIDADQDLFLRILPTGLTYYHWSFDEMIEGSFGTTGTEPHADRIKTNMTTRTIKTVSGRNGNAVEFSAGKGHLRSTWPGIESNRPRTISCWVKIPPGKNWGDIVTWGVPQKLSSKWNVNLNMEVDDEGGIEGALRISFGYGYIIGTTDLRDGRWHHIAAAYDGSEIGNPSSITLYVDGKQETITAYKENKINTILDDPRSNPVMIGRNLTGIVDELYVHQGVLPDQIIAEISKR